MCIFKHISGISVWVDTGIIPVMLTSLWKQPGVGRMAPEGEGSVPHGNGFSKRSWDKRESPENTELGLSAHLTLSFTKRLARFHTGRWSLARRWLSDLDVSLLGTWYSDLRSSTWLIWASWQWRQELTFTEHVLCTRPFGKALYVTLCSHFSQSHFEVGIWMSRYEIAIFHFQKRNCHFCMWKRSNIGNFMWRDLIVR